MAERLWTPVRKHWYEIAQCCLGYEHIQVNTTDPWTEVDGERSNPKTKHPLFSDPALRHALGLLVDRASIQAHIYGRTGVATGNFINSPERFLIEV